MGAATTPGVEPRHSIRFFLDGECIELQDVDPNRTVLQFLREDLARTGTKEGCAEGDCGACTVVIAEPAGDGKRLRARAINSCIQFLPTLDGKELFTVESLARNGLHPIQQAMVDCHGSQCGFCTPGFVMSLFALYKTAANPSRRQIDEELAGNLCRCTGYQPIINAANRMYEAAHGSDWTCLPAGQATQADERERIAALQSLASDSPLSVVARGRAFFAPLTVDHFADLLLAHPRAMILAGGTDVGLWVTKQHRELDTIVYSGRVAELCALEKGEEYLEIGAAVSLTDAMPMILSHYPAFGEVFTRFASPPIRNAGTLGGNIANGSPIGDSMPLLLAVDTLLFLRKGSARRTMALSDFYSGYQQTALSESEFIERIRIPLPARTDVIAGYKISKRFDQDISAVCAGFRLRLAAGKVDDIRLAFGGMAEIPRRALHCEQTLAGAEWNTQTVSKAAAALAEDFTPISDMRSSAAYRMQVCQNLLLRFFHESTGNAPTRVYQYGR